MGGIIPLPLRSDGSTCSADLCLRSGACTNSEDAESVLVTVEAGAGRETLRAAGACLAVRGLSDVPSASRREAAALCPAGRVS